MPARCATGERSVGVSSILWIDVETSALGDKAALLEIALVPVINGEKKEPFVSYIRPHEGAFIDLRALEINKIDPKLFPTFPSLHEVISKIIAYIDSFETVFSLGGHNVNFDRDHFYRAFCRTANYGNYVTRIDSSTICTWQLAKEVFKNKKKRPEKMSLGALCSYFDIDLVNAHTAFADIDATIKLYDYLIALKPKTVVTPSNLTYHQKRTKYMAADYLTINPEGDVYIHNKGTKDPDAILFILNELWRIYVKD